MKKFIAVFLVLVLTFSGCLSGEKRVSDSGFYLNTYVTVTLLGTDDPTPIQAAFDEIERLEGLLSADMAGSDVARINENAGIAPVKVSEETLHILNTAKTVHALSGGAFSVTVRPLVTLWNVTGGGYVPTDAEKREAMALICDEDIQTDGDTVYLPRSGMGLDLGAIAKGYIADRVTALLLASGVPGGILDLGGNVTCFGSHADGSPFRVGIQDPFGETGTSLGTLTVPAANIVTSGDYERYFERDGVRYHHILDPDTGAPAKSGLSGVTVVTDSSELADGLSTAVFLMGKEKGLALFDSLDGVEGIFVEADGTVTVTEGLRKSFTKK